jgi:hypothetical protein
VNTAAIGRTCQVDACRERVPATLHRHGVCLSHYLDDVFTRSAAALQLCQRGERVDPRTVDWLQSQGDFAVRLLSKNDLLLSLEERSRLLELLLCLTNIQEYVRKHSLSRVS